jgi:hypothetical protein
LIAFFISEAVSVFFEDLLLLRLGSLSPSELSTFSEIFSSFLIAFSAAELDLSSDDDDADAFSDFFEDLVDFPSVAFSIAFTADLASAFLASIRGFSGIVVK